MNIKALRDMLMKFAEKAPFDAAAIGNKQVHKYRLPARKPDGKILGPANLTETEKEARLGGLDYVEVTATGGAQSDLEQLCLQQLRELKLIYVQTKPVSGSFESVAPGGHKNFKPRILGLTVKGADFLELSRDQTLLEQTIGALKSRAAFTFTNLLRELKKSSNTPAKEVEND